MKQQNMAFKWTGTMLPSYWRCVFKINHCHLTTMSGTHSPNACHTYWHSHASVNVLTQCAWHVLMLKVTSWSPRTTSSTQQFGINSFSSFCVWGGGHCVRVCGCIRILIHVWLSHTGWLLKLLPLPSASEWLEPIQSWAGWAEWERRRGKGERGRDTEREKVKKERVATSVVSAARLLLDLQHIHCSSCRIHRRTHQTPLSQWTDLNGQGLVFFLMPFILQAWWKCSNPVDSFFFWQSLDTSVWGIYCFCLHQENFYNHLWKHGESLSFAENCQVRVRGVKCK